LKTATRIRADAAFRNRFAKRQSAFQFDPAENRDREKLEITVCSLAELDVSKNTTNTENASNTRRRGQCRGQHVGRDQSSQAALHCMRTAELER